MASLKRSPQIVRMDSPKSDDATLTPEINLNTMV